MKYSSENDVVRVGESWFFYVAFFILLFDGCIEIYKSTYSLGSDYTLACFSLERQKRLQVYPFYYEIIIFKSKPCLYCKTLVFIVCMLFWTRKKYKCITYFIFHYVVLSFNYRTWLMLDCDCFECEFGLL